MVKKLKQGQKYQEGFTQKHILLKLCEKDKTPTTEILDFLKDQFGIREPKNVRIHLKKLEDGKLIKKDSAGVGHVDYWSVIFDFKVLRELIERFKHDPDSQRALMKSSYCRDLVLDSVERFDGMMPLHDIIGTKPLFESPTDDESYRMESSAVYLSDTYNTKESGNGVVCCVIEYLKDRACVTFDINDLSDDDVKVLKRYLIKHGVAVE